jgi:hypothetical protein
LTKTLRLRLNEDLYERIVAAAEESNITAVLRQAVRVYLAVHRELEARR